MRRLVVPEASLAEGALALPKELAHYVRDVLRLGEGAGLLLLDGAGGEAEAELRAVDKKQVTLQVGPVRRTPAPSPALVLLQAVGKGDKMDQVVRQATELGVAEVVPVLTARAVARQEGRVERWRTICEDAVRVAGHRHRPRIAEVTPLTEALAGAPEGLRLALALDAAAPLAQRLAEAEPGVPITVLVGPEGGSPRTRSPRPGPRASSPPTWGIAPCAPRPRAPRCSPSWRSGPGGWVGTSALDGAAPGASLGPSRGRRSATSMGWGAWAGRARRASSSPSRWWPSSSWAGGWTGSWAPRPG